VEPPSKGSKTPAVLAAVKSFITSLLAGPGYNTLMTGLRRDLKEGPVMAVRLEQADFERVLRLVAWVTRYARLRQVGGWVGGGEG
jgi:hypothetical protein